MTATPVAACLSRYVNPRRRTDPRSSPQSTYPPHPPPGRLPLIDIRTHRRGQRTLSGARRPFASLVTYIIRQFARASTGTISSLFARPLADGEVILGFCYR